MTTAYSYGMIIAENDSNLTFLTFICSFLVCFCTLGWLVFAALLLDTCSCDTKAQMRTKKLNGNIHTYTVVAVCGQFSMDGFGSFWSE